MDLKKYDFIIIYTFSFYHNQCLNLTPIKRQHWLLLLFLNSFLL